MELERKCELIIQTLDHPAGKEQRVNTLWVGSMAFATCYGILGLKYGQGSWRDALDESLARKDHKRIDELFYYLIRYMIDMDIIK